ncbi:hypothetical protein ACFV2A_11800 [Streptomyces californicus]|uniref:hypothetical protein n=1 Tax=Streptomyces californicus TaxID=67351 RepID=UPI00368A7033
MVEFRGDDGREEVFDVGQLPLPGWHRDLATSWAARCGPAGALRTRTSARNAFYSIDRFMRFLDELDRSPATAGDLRVEVIEEFARRFERHVQSVNLLLSEAPLKDKLDQAVVDFTVRRFPGRPRAGTGGYSEGELSRVLAAARADVAAMKRRIEAGEDLLARARTGRPSDEEVLAVKQLAGMAETGMVPWPEGVAEDRPPNARRVQLAGRLFVTLADLPPLLLLMVALSERNIETVKELPARHRILGDRQAVELEVIKRRRGPGHWFETVTWEIGPAGRELHTPGGLYLLIHQLTSRSRAFAGVDHLLTLWSMGNRRKTSGLGEHIAPFAKALSPGLPSFAAWNRARRQPVFADAAPGAGPQLLKITSHKVRTSMEARRTKKMGGHLPSAARSNTFPVLFKDYLQGDATIREWADEVIGQALAEAESAALEEHRRALAGAGGSLTVLPRQRQTSDQEGQGGPWSGCRDPEAHPVTGQRCTQSLLACFSCGNCLVTADRLPALLGLLRSLSERRTRLPEQVWWSRYGQAWAAIRHDILARFSPEQVEAARRQVPVDSLLDWAEDPWEVP